MGWQIIERWQLPGELQTTELYLMHIDDVFVKAWRVEWGTLGGYRKGESYAGEGREERARRDLEARKARYGDGWQMVS